MNQGIPPDPEATYEVAWTSQEHQDKRPGSGNIQQHPSQQLANRMSGRDI